MLRKMAFASVCLVGFNLQGLTLLLDWWPNPNHIPLYAGIAKGIFSKHGIELCIKKSSDTSSTATHIALGNGDIGLYYMLQGFAAAEKSDLRMLCPYIDKPLQGFLMREETTCLKKIGGYPSKYFSFFTKLLSPETCEVPLQGELPLYLHMQRVDALYGVYNTIEGHQLASRGVKTRFISLTEYGVPTYAELVFITTAGFAEKEPSLLQSFQAALVESIAYAKKYPDEAFALYAKANPDKAPRTLSWEEHAWKDTIPLFSETCMFEKSMCETVFTWLSKHGFIEQSKPLASYFTGERVFSAKSHPQERVQSSNEQRLQP